MSKPTGYIDLLEELALLTSRGVSRICKSNANNEIEELEVTCGSAIDIIRIDRKSLPGASQVERIRIQHRSTKDSPTQTRTFTFQRNLDNNIIHVIES